MSHATTCTISLPADAMERIASYMAAMGVSRDDAIAHLICAGHYAILSHNNAIPNPQGFSAQGPYSRA